MLFNSWQFLPFIAVVLALYFVLPFRWQNRMLLAASCLFYGAWDWRFLVLLVISTSIDYVVARRIEASHDERVRRRLLFVSCAANLGILGFFKYFNFFVDSAVDAAHLLGMELSGAHLNVILPVGISFYTFHAMSYNVDVYRGKLKPIRSFPDYMLFVLFFPQLVAGPIARAALLIPQVTHPRSVRRDQILAGLWLVLWGYFKKMVVADNLAPLVGRVFEGDSQASGLECLLAVYAFAYQIYCDFSGYTDIARGLAKIMGFELTLNFNLPYLAKSPAEFWHRWHISLSTWLRDYLYIPLGGSRHGTWKTYRNLAVTMLLGGLWHGAAWNFVLWGAYHGLLLCVHRLLGGERADDAKPARPWTAVLSCIGMFHLTCLGWLFFRANSLSQIGGLLRRMATDLSPTHSAVEMLAPLVLFAGLLWLIEAWIQNADDPSVRPAWNWGLGPLTVSGLLAALVVFTSGPPQQFLYFQF
ncbi:MAG TPA: MBOAT family protein [Pirellulales bacterium]|nr:MBOAT family protein [Pirellulales bacterium]